MATVPFAAWASDYVPDESAIRVVQSLVEQDLLVSSSGGKGIFALPKDVDSNQLVMDVGDWLARRKPNASDLSPQDKADIFGLYLVATLLPKSTICAVNAASAQCEHEFMAAMDVAKDHRADIQAAYVSAQVPLGLPPMSQMRKPEPAPATQQLPMPHPQVLVNADRQCDDLAFSSGRDSFGEACKRGNHKGFEDLQAMRSDPEIRQEFWNACADAVGFKVSANFLGWSQCVKFARKACPASKIVGAGEDYLRCLRAIRSDGWILNRAAQ